MAAARSSRRRLLGTEVLPIRAESAYPLITPGPRVRVAAFAPFLKDHAVALYDTDKRYTTSDDLTSCSMRPSLSVALWRCAAG
jgi:hypothetical protein